MNDGGSRKEIEPDPPTSPLESTSSLLQRARNGDRQALDILCHRNLPLLRKWASHRLPPWARDLLNTDDLVQDALLQTLKHIEGFEPRREGALRAYLRQAVHNLVLNEIRRVQRKPPAELLVSGKPDLGPSPLEETVGREVVARYEAALKRLSPDDREVIVARIEMSLDYKEVAESTGRSSPDAARVAVGRALVRLAQEMRLERTR